MAMPRMMVVLFVAVGVVAVAVVALTLESWWILGVALVIHFLATLYVVIYALGRAGETYDKPDPVTEARLEEGLVATRMHGTNEHLRAEYKGSSEREDDSERPIRRQRPTRQHQEKGET
jgi:membrane protein implicated in regulation of membrane protease activity